MMIMPFGKYRGQFIENIPGDYLEWVLANCSKIRPALKKEIQRVLGELNENDEDERDREYESAVLKEIAENIEQLRRKTLRGLHPDSGGNPETFKAAKAHFDRLKMLLDEIGVVNR